MRKFLVSLVMISFVLGSAAPVWAGANEKAYEHADENAIFNRVGDWFATVGKSEEEAKQIIAQRKAERAQKRAEKMAKKKKAEADKKAKEMKKKMKFGN